MMQLVDTRWRSQLAILLENIEALKADNSAWEETPAGKAITYQLRDYRGAYLFLNSSVKRSCRVMVSRLAWSISII